MSKPKKRSLEERVSDLAKRTMALEQAVMSMNSDLNMYLRSDFCKEKHAAPAVERKGERYYVGIHDGTGSHAVYRRNDEPANSVISIMAFGMNEQRAREYAEFLNLRNS